LDNRGVSRFRLVFRAGLSRGFSLLIWRHVRRPASSKMPFAAGTAV